MRCDLISCLTFLQCLDFYCWILVTDTLVIWIIYTRLSGHLWRIWRIFFCIFCKFNKLFCKYWFMLYLLKRENTRLTLILFIISLFSAILIPQNLGIVILKIQFYYLIFTYIFSSPVLHVSSTMYTFNTWWHSILYSFHIKHVQLYCLQYSGNESNIFVLCICQIRRFQRMSIFS